MHIHVSFPRSLIPKALSSTFVTRFISNYGLADSLIPILLFSLLHLFSSTLVMERDQGIPSSLHKPSQPAVLSDPDGPTMRSIPFHPSQYRFMDF